MISPYSLLPTSYSLLPTSYSLLPTSYSLLHCDLHTHTSYSRDCLVSPERFLEVCRRRGLDRVAVTDHNTIAGALRLKEMDPERIIVGQEIRTTRGELIAYFLTEPIPPDLPPQEAIAAVRAQGGVVGISHPLDRARREAMGRADVEALLAEVDFLEGFNARCLSPADNVAVLALARAHNLPVTAGSDAHSLWELGRAGVRMPPFDSPASFLESLRSAQIWGKISPVWVHAVSTLAKILRRLGR
ncbi:MAG: PHP domain-containing protein [Anaerolineae bacterium]|nr:PHP domain-containing protein [Anaerolineae bacterium]MCX8067293.1 PHP domain-containing protein [Anaerolineae bacterium]MDW7990839.1 PHP domain-containing protein [Anaerolineae bacterium]